MTKCHMKAVSTIQYLLFSPCDMLVIHCWCVILIIIEQGYFISKCYSICEQNVQRKKQVQPIVCQKPHIRRSLLKDVTCQDNEGLQYLSLHQHGNNGAILTDRMLKAGPNHLIFRYLWLMENVVLLLNSKTSY